MTVPPDYERAYDNLMDFLALARDAAGLTTRHQTYTMVEGVFRAFRRRLRPKQALQFAQALPPLLQVMFIRDWDPEEPLLPFTDRASLTREVQALRHNHNLAPDDAIEAVSKALQKYLKPEEFKRALSNLPEEAQAFWALPETYTSA